MKSAAPQAMMRLGRPDWATNTILKFCNNSLVDPSNSSSSKNYSEYNSLADHLSNSSSTAHNCTKSNCNNNFR